MLDLIKRFNGEFKISYSISGTAIEQMKRFNPEVLDSFKRLVDTGCVELISETYYHSLSFLHSTNEFERQIQKHKELIQKEFGYTSQTFRNTELIYSNSVAATADRLGYKAILAEGTEKILGWRNANFVYQPVNCSNIKVLLRNYQLSDDIAFRFSNRGWAEHPLTADKFSTWVHGFDGNAETINLFMDYETFGEHQWSETGIFDFMWALPEYLLSHTGFKFNTPSQVVDMYPVRDKLDVHNYVSWADTERDLSAWKGNNLQDDALESVFKLEEKVYRTKDEGLIETWQALLTSDHFYYMCTKWFSDGDVHKYFNPYQSPYEAYINYQNVLTDFEAVVNARTAQLQEIK
jgi:alpha-amylase